MSNSANIPALLRTACPVVKIENGQAVTLSTEVARVFGKRHDDVLKAIRNLLPDLTTDHVRNFAETVVTRENPSGEQSLPPHPRRVYLAGNGLYRQKGAGL